MTASIDCATDSEVGASSANRNQGPRTALAKKQLIVIADDDSSLQSAYEEMLSQKLPECEIVGKCKNGLEVVERVGAMTRNESQEIVVLMDYQMPQMDGLSAARILRSKNENNKLNLRIVLVSGCDLPEKSQEKYFDAIVKKPFVAKDLLYAISQK